MKAPANPRRAALAGLLALAAVPALAPPAAAAEAPDPPPARNWSFDGPFGLYDRPDLRRGLQVYREVCAACHAMKYLHYRNLAEPGGPELSAEQAKAIAAAYQITDGPDSEGDMFERPGRPSDPFAAPFPNDQAARAANGGALPPDLSLMVRARAGAADYLYALLTGYGPAPQGVKVPEGQYYNRYFPGGVLAMAPPLSDDLIEYPDGVKADAAQMAHDVVTFLAWAAAPKMEARKRLGFQVMIYLIVLTGLLYFANRKIWAEAPAPDQAKAGR